MKNILLSIFFFGIAFFTVSLIDKNDIKSNALTVFKSDSQLQPNTDYYIPPNAAEMSVHFYLPEGATMVIAGSLNVFGDSEIADNILIAGRIIITESGNLNIGTNSNTTVFETGEIINSGCLYNLGGLINRGEITNLSSGYISGIKTDNNENYFPPFDFTGQKSPAEILENAETEVSYGVDVSVYQGNIDWVAAKRSGVSYALIRAGRGRLDAYRGPAPDSYFATNMANATAAGIPVGVYWYCYAENVKQAREEAYYCVELLKNYNLQLPVLMDFEEALPFVSKAEINEMIITFCDILRANGYFPMLYTYKNYVNSYIYPSTISVYPLALAEFDVAFPTYQGKYYIWQYSCKGSVNGINGDVDLDIFYRNFPKLLN